MEYVRSPLELAAALPDCLFEHRLAPAYRHHFRSIPLHALCHHVGLEL